MIWNYRIRRTKTGFALVECYYEGRRRKIMGWTEPICIGSCLKCLESAARGTAHSNKDREYRMQAFMRPIMRKKD